MSKWFAAGSSAIMVFVLLFVAGCQQASPFQGLNQSPPGATPVASPATAAETPPASAEEAPAAATPAQEQVAEAGEASTSEASSGEAGAEPEVTAARSAPAVTLRVMPPSLDAHPSAAEIFARVSPAIAFVETPSATGSGVLIQGRYLLSNAHVVWPYEAVRVVFPDGSEFLDVPVVGWDLAADLALVGPIDTTIEPVALVDGGAMEIGTDVYLIGYPAEVDEFPQPTITNGILSRMRLWEAIDYDFFQVDATITNGQSGGVMVNQHGDVVGISTFYYSGFGLAGSVADALPRLNAILGHETGAEILHRTFSSGEQGRTFQDVLRDEDDRRRYVFRAPVDEEIELQATGVGRPQVIASPVYGYQLESTVGTTDPEEQTVTLSFSVQHDEPYIVEVFQSSKNENAFVLTSTYTLTAYPDPDDWTPLQVGDSYMGMIDVPLDRDVFLLDLAAGQRIEALVDALGVDPYIQLVYQTETLEEVVVDDDSGGGIFGESGKIVYQAPEDGTYKLYVSSVGYDSAGGYFVSLKEAPEDAELTEPETSRRFLPSQFGLLTWYESEDYPFSVLRPAQWDELPGSQCGPGVKACFGDETAAVLIVEESLLSLPKADRSQEGYVGLLLDLIESQAGIELISHKPFTTYQGLRTDRLAFSVQNGRVHGERMVYVDLDNQVAFSLSVLIRSDVAGFLDGFADQLMESFRVWPEDVDKEQSAVFHLDEGRRLLAEEQYEDALAAFSRAIELDPDLAAAYRARGGLHYGLGRMEEALADIDEAIRLEPDDADAFNFRAMMHWHLGESEQALADITMAMALEPDRPQDYNILAFIHAQMGDYDAAIAAIEKTKDFTNGELLPSIQDTLAFIYLQMGDLEKAKAEYEAILNKDLRFGYALLGAGVVYGLQGDEEKAASLISEAMEDIDEISLKNPDPQLAALLEMAEPFRTDQP